MSGVVIQAHVSKQGSRAKEVYEEIPDYTVGTLFSVKFNRLCFQ